MRKLTKPLYLQSILLLVLFSCNRNNELLVVETLNIENVASISATVNCSITGNDDKIIARGVCYSSQPNPTINDEYFNEGQGIGNFKVALFGLNKITPYYVRAFASTEKETIYGNELHFATTEHIGVNINGTVYYTYETANVGQIPWGPEGFTGYTGTDDGKMNTKNIAAIGDEFAATKCNELVLENYNNWFVPAVDEWIEIMKYSSGYGILNTDVNYWTSTDSDEKSAYVYNGTTGSTLAIKDSHNRCQCFRKEE